LAHDLPSYSAKRGELALPFSSAEGGKEKGGGKGKAQERPQQVLLFASKAWDVRSAWTGDGEKRGEKKKKKGKRERRQGKMAAAGSVDFFRGGAGIPACISIEYCNFKIGGGKEKEGGGEGKSSQVASFGTPRITAWNRRAPERKVKRRGRSNEVVHEKIGPCFRGSSLDKGRRIK